jgi:hypothetical protein
VGQRKCAFKETDVARLVKAAKRAGLEVARIEVENGKIVVVAAGKPATETASNEWDEGNGDH